MDSQSFGPVDADTHIMGRAVHCSVLRHWINNSATARAEDMESNWVIPLAPQTLSDLAQLWVKTRQPEFMEFALPKQHRARPPTIAKVQCNLS